MKKFADDGNTNLYVSNLPKEMNEHELGAIFAPHKVCSSRILRDSAGVGRGVGFARFESRDVCDTIIKNFNNSAVSKAAGEEHIIQIRFADTAEQKMLKQRTAAARQFRTAEYEYGVQARNQGLLGPQRLITDVATVPQQPDDVENFLHRAARQATLSPLTCSKQGSYAQAGKLCSSREAMLTSSSPYDLRYGQAMARQPLARSPLSSVTNQRLGQPVVGQMKLPTVTKSPDYKPEAEDKARSSVTVSDSEHTSSAASEKYQASSDVVAL